MPIHGLPLPEHGEPPFRFTATRWSLVLAAGGSDPESSRKAMARLLEAYWYPLYAFVRRKGHGPEDACDLTQGFVARLLERNLIGAADPERGKFRTFLLASLERFLVNEWRREGRVKRGGGRAPISLSLFEAEDRYRLEPADPQTPERIFERRWAMTLLEQALERLEEECVAKGRKALFSSVRPVLAGEDGVRAYSAIAADLGMTEGALKTQVHRLRRRFGTLLRAEIAQTVADADELEEEIQHLIRSLK
jgi:RNA polymerase sigma-70 factor (ECF subfamily)